MTDRSKSLEEIEGDDWGETTFDSHLVKTCHRLRRKPIVEFSVEDVRIMVGQQIGLEHLAPLAIEMLESNPLAKGDFYPGDLLKTLIGAPKPDFWFKHPDWARRLMAALDQARRRLAAMEDSDRRSLEDMLGEEAWHIERIRAAANSAPEGIRRLAGESQEHSL